MTHKEFIRILRGQFWGLLRRKTGWGRNELMVVFNQACTNALAKELDAREIEEIRDARLVGRETTHLTFPNGSEIELEEREETP